ncbi:MAG TPA: peptidoglycan editing factor PgeF [Spirochaetota bacterium]|nr:peptidoglycan editing factor PgeF [Spirochaetota bacterium]
MKYGKKQLQAGILSKIDNLKHGFGTRYSRPDRKSFPFAEHIIAMEQVHGCKIHDIKAEKNETGNNRQITTAGQGDALVTGLKKLALAVKTADCVPVLLYADLPVISAVHCGWRSSAARILSKTVTYLQKHYKIKPGKLRAALGPAICGSCFTVGPEVIKAFPQKLIKKNVNYFKTDYNKYKLDLRAVLKQELAELGLSPSNIEIINRCTVCHNQLFFSYRLEKEKAGRQWSLIMLT